jgi:ubiquinone biosynthesis protein UbiJ
MARVVGYWPAFCSSRPRKQIHPSGWPLVLTFYQAVTQRGQSAVVQAINFAIERDQDLHDHLKPLAGKTIELVFDLQGPLQGKRLRLHIEADGLLHEPSVKQSSSFSPVPSSQAAQVADQDGEANVTLQIASEFFIGALEQTLAGGLGSGATAGPGMKGIRIQGDAAVAEKLGPLIAVIRSKTAPVFDAATSHPLAFMAKRFVDYAIHDAKLVVTKQDFQAHTQDLRTLRDATERLEKKIQALEQSRAQ